MRKISIKILLKSSNAHYVIVVLITLIFLGCTSTKNEGKSILSGLEQNTGQVKSIDYGTATSLYNYGFDTHEYISFRTEETIPVSSNDKDAVEQTIGNTRVNEIIERVGLDTKSKVADRIVENYINSENKEPNGHCLTVSKIRFEKAYKEVYGHSLYQDLPDSMATKFYSPKQVFNMLYASTSEPSQKWRSLPEKYRGKGNAGAIAYAGMGTLLDTMAIWSGQLRPGALMQVWRFKDDYELVVKGVDVKKLDPYGHSFIFISYVRDEKNKIIGLKIADQGFQSYRPLIPGDYEVWWAVNLSV